MLHDECRAAERPVPPVAVWPTTVVEPCETGLSEASTEQLRRGPERLELRDELPRNPLGKILERELRDELRQ